MKFDYYYGKEAEQFSFIRIPKLLLTHEAFSGLSIQAKVLFGVLLDRMSLSMKNDWMDEENRVYIIYQIQEIQEDLGFSRKKAMDYLGELEKIGLVEKKRRGLGLPSILYVKSFMSGVEEENSEEERLDISDQDNSADNSAENGTSRSVDLGTSEETACAESVTDENIETRENDDETADSGTKNTEIGAKTGPGTEKRTDFQVKSRVYKRHPPRKNPRSVDLRTSRGADLGTSRGSENGLQEVPVWAPLKNNTKINNTYLNNITSDLISSSDGMGSDEMRTKAYRKLIEGNINFKTLLDRYPYDREMVEGIADIMLEVVLNRNETMRIASATYPTGLVRSRFLKLNFEHVQYVIECFNKNTTKVGNIKKYLMTALFNAPSTIGGYYTAAVHHDMPYLAK